MSAKTAVITGKVIITGKAAQDLLDENARLRSALAAYADEANWRRMYDHCGDPYIVWRGTFGPLIARGALNVSETSR